MEFSVKRKYSYFEDFFYIEVKGEIYDFSSVGKKNNYLLLTCTQRIIHLTKKTKI